MGAARGHRGHRHLGVPSPAGDWWRWGTCEQGCGVHYGAGGYREGGKCGHSIDLNQWGLEKCLRS